MINQKQIDESTFEIIVPKGVRYISQWGDYQIFPFNHVVNKQIPGCGFTEFCIMNNQNLVLCSPRKILLENKNDQHKGEVYYVVSNFDDAAIDQKIKTITVAPGKGDKKAHIIGETAASRKEKIIKARQELKEQKEKYYQSLKADIQDYIQKRWSEGKPFKILVTYDSFYVIRNFFKEYGYPLNTQIVVDEWQSIFVDSTFKASTENKFLQALTGFTRICFVSATPMLRKYLKQMEPFNKLPFYEFDWYTNDPVRVKKPGLDPKYNKSPMNVASQVIQSYLDGNFEKKIVKRESGVVEEVYSKEAVLYFNSVDSILSLIKKKGLTSDQVNILCAKTKANIEKIHKKIGKKFSIGKVPLKGEPHKMFTFCTRTVYLGADFYSTNARTFIFSDANVETLTVDISLDLPQIMGRQRLVENPWKDDAEFYYKVYSDNNKLSEEEFNGIIQDRINMTNSLLNTYNRADPNDQANVGESYEVLASTGYVNSYLSVNRVYIDADNFIRVPVFNELVKIAQRRAYDIQQIDYADRFAIFSEIDSSTSLGVVKSEEVKDFFRGFEKLRTLSDKLKYYVNYPCDSETKVIILNQITEKHFLEYITVLGEDRVKACSYNISALNKELGVIVFDPNVLINRVYQEFKEGDTISVADLKLKIAEIYKEVGYNKTPKATEILNWFDIKKIKIRTQTGDRVNGFELEKKK